MRMRINLLRRQPHLGLRGVGKTYASLMQKSTGKFFSYQKTFPKNPRYKALPGGSISFVRHVPRSTIPRVSAVRSVAHYRPQVVSDLKRMLGASNVARKMGRGKFGGEGAFAGMGRGWRRLLKGRKRS